MSPLERRSVAAVAGLYVFRMLGLFMVLPVLALYGTEYQGSTPLWIGLAVGAYGLTQAIFQIPFGLLSDRIGRKPVIVAGLLIFGAGSVLAAVSESIYGVVAGRALQGMGAIASTLMALLADLTRDQHRTKGMALVGMSIGMSFTVAVILGPLIASHFGISAIFALTAALAGIGLFILLTAVPTPQRLMQQAEAQAVPAMLGDCLRNPDLLRLNVGIFVLHLVVMASFLAVPVVLESLGFARDQHALIYLAVLVLSFVAMMPLLMAGERRGKSKPVFIFAVALLLATTAVTAVVALGSWAFLLVLWLFFLGFNLLEASLPSLVSRTAPAGTRGTAMGVYSSAQFLGAFVGGAAGGAVMDQWGVDGVFALTALACALWLPVALFMRMPGKVKNLVFEFDSEGEQLDSTADSLRNLPGVLEVMVMAEDKLAYLKVKPDFDRSQLERLKSA